MAPAGFEHANPASEGLQKHALDRAATGLGTEPDASAKYIKGLRDMAFGNTACTVIIWAELHTVWGNETRAKDLRK